MRVLTVRQPWAWLLFNGKPVENRDWWTAYRGILGIHAAKGMTRGEYDAAIAFVWQFDEALARRIPAASDLVRSAIVGTVRQVDCVRQHPSPFFQGHFGHVYVEPREFSAPIAARGALGFWKWEPAAAVESLWRPI
jgi:hypothetical protein